MTGAPLATSSPWCSATWATTAATGVALTRDGRRRHGMYGEYLINAQGEDVVDGSQAQRDRARRSARTCRTSTRSWTTVGNKLEKHYQNVQDIEFTVAEEEAVDAADPQRQADRVRGRARSPSDMVEEGLITKEEPSASTGIPPDDLNQLLQPIFDPDRAKGQRRRASCWPRASTPGPVPPPAGSSSSPTKPRTGSPSMASLTPTANATPTAG